MTWVRSPVPIPRHAAAQFRITVPHDAARWARCQLEAVRKALKEDNASSCWAELAPTQVRQTMSKFLPRCLKTIAVHVTPLQGRAAHLLQELRDKILQAGHGFWFDFMDSCPSDLSFSPITVDPAVAIHAVGVAAARWSAHDTAVQWDFPHKGWLLMAEPVEEALSFAEALRSSDDRLLRFRKPMNWHLNTRIAMNDESGLNCTIWAVTLLEDPTLIEYQLAPLTPADVAFLNDELRTHLPMSGASFAPAHVLDADGRPIGAAILRVKRPEYVADDLHPLLQTFLQQGVFNWRGVRCDIARYAGCSSPCSRTGAALMPRDSREDLWAWDAQSRPGQREHLQMPPMLRLHPLPMIEVAGREHGSTTLPCPELAVCIGTSALGLQLPASTTPHAVERPLLTFTTDHPTDMRWLPVQGSPDSAVSKPN